MDKCVVIGLLIFNFGINILFSQALEVKPFGVSPRDTQASEADIYDIRYGGLRNIGTGTKVYLIGTFKDSMLTEASWHIFEKPNGSQSIISEPTGRDAASEVVTFIADLEGTYRIKISEGSYADTVIINAARYLGVENCSMCHTHQKDEWVLTGHSSSLERGLEGLLSNYYSTPCIRCHSTGYDPNAGNAGFDDFEFVFPDTLHEGMADSMYSLYPDAMGRANIQCESCHGPGSAHNGQLSDSKMVTSLSSNVCALCHDSDTFHTKPYQWDFSRHAKLTTKPASERIECRGCHNGVQFIQYVNGQEIQPQSDAPISCAACHQSHGSTNESQLRTIEVTLSNGKALSEGGKGKLCMNCHQSRREANEYTDEPHDHYGPHYAPQADMLAGTNAIDFGTTLKSSQYHSQITNSCVDCHMAYVSSEGEIPIVGSHTFAVSDTLGNDNVAICENCHSAFGNSFEDIKYYSNSIADHDGDGIEEGLQLEVQGLMDTLAALLPASEGNETYDPWDDVDMSWSLAQLKAAYNYEMVYFDGSCGIHNPAFTVDILKVSIQALKYDTTNNNLITFQVDMSKKMIKSEFQPHSGDQVIVRGNFNGWVSNDNLLSDFDIDSIYTGTFEVGYSAGDTLSYKFVMLHPEDSVTWERQEDRTFILSGNPEMLPLVYFSNDTSTKSLQSFTDPASNISMSTAILNGRIVPNGYETYVRFEYGETQNYGNIIIADQSPLFETAEVGVTATLSGLAANTTYHYRILVSNISGDSFGADQSFTTKQSGSAPTAITTQATNVASNEAVLNGTVNPNNLETEVIFHFGTTTSYGDSIVANESPFTGTSDVIVSANISELLESTTYHYRVKAKNSAGTGYGEDQSFTTGQSGGAPFATTASASNITEISTTLNGSVNPNNLSTEVLFYYGSTTSYGDSTFANQSPVSGGSNLAVSTTLSNLTPDSDYYFKVVAVNSMGRTHGTNQQFHTLNDTQFPVINSVSNPSVALTEDVTITADITDNTGLESVFINYRRGGEISFVEQQMEFDGSAYSAQIPNNILSDKGVEYYLKATDFGGNSSNSNRYMLRISIPDNTLNFNYSGGSTQNAYRMISIPLLITNPSIQNVLLDDLGTYDKSNWRLFRDINDQYYEHPNTGDFTASRAFWLICRESVIIDVPGGHTVFAEDDLEISLQEGWNQIGLPFNYPIAWQDILEASAHPNINGPYLYEGSYSIPTILEPFKGYYINNLENHTISLNIPFRGNGANVLKPPSDIEKWQIRIMAKVQSALDDLNIVGVSSSAHDEWDRNDLLEPPPIGDFVSVYFPHPDWETYPGNYAIDMRNDSEKGYFWDFEVITSVDNSEIELYFPDIDKVISIKDFNSNFEIILIDRQLRIAHDIISKNKIFIPTPPTDQARLFRLIIGEEDFVESNNLGITALPSHSMLYQNFPNPFNSSTYIIYSLPQETNVSLIIYNLLGEKIKILHSNQPQQGEYYSLPWDGKNDFGKGVASGVYIYQLRTEETVQTKKMILIR